MVDVIIKSLHRYQNVQRDVVFYVWSQLWCVEKFQWVWSTWYLSTWTTGENHLYVNHQTPLPLWLQSILTQIKARSLTLLFLGDAWGSVIHAPNLVPEVLTVSGPVIFISFPHAVKTSHRLGDTNTSHTASELNDEATVRGKHSIMVEWSLISREVGLIKMDFEFSLKNYVHWHV